MIANALAKAFGNLCSLPQTLAEDGRTVECLCLSVFPMPLGSYVQMRVVALLELEDQVHPKFTCFTRTRVQVLTLMSVVALLDLEYQNGPNHKVIGVPDEEPRLLEYQVHPGLLALLVIR